MAILDLIPHLFPTGGGVSTLDLAASEHMNPAKQFIRAHFWIVGVGLALVCFVIAATKPIGKPGEGDPMPRRAWVLMWSAIGGICLIVAAYFAVNGVGVQRIHRGQ